MTITIVLVDGSTNGQGAGGWTETLLRVVSVTTGILVLETGVPGDSRNTTPDAEDAPGYYPMWGLDPTKQPWDDQEEQTPRTGCTSRPKKYGETGLRRPTGQAMECLRTYNLTTSTHETLDKGRELHRGMQDPGPWT
ncbi:hypothetical protein K438DRAFT_1775301 [Mycena galopus ATCC 62051]|nr:hypothetical protein K438DRAFT_1775301 [Mycena galopus ATCC 62051]